MDEFRWIDRLRPLTRDDPRALNLMDDAAVLPSRPGHDLVISTDALVEGVHFLAGEAMDLVARRLLRTSLSDLAAKAAEPFGYFLTTGWPARFDDAERDRFIAGLDEDGRAFDVVLLGGDTVSTSGPLTLSATVLGWVPTGRMVARGGARAGDVCVVCGTIGDGWLGLRAARGEIDDDGELAARYRLPVPLFGLRDALRRYARAAADVSDGLIADAWHIAEASGTGLDIDLALAPLSLPARAWLERQGDPKAARIALAVGGDDYAIVAAIAPPDVAGFMSTIAKNGLACALVGAFKDPGDLGVMFETIGISVEKNRLAPRSRLKASTARVLTTV